MKIFNYIVLISVLTSFYSCSEERVQFGKSSYYPSFLWVDEKQVCAEKTFVFDFSQDAKNDYNTFAEFAFVDGNGKIMNDNCLHTYIGTEKLQNNTFKILSSTDSVTIRFEFSPNADGGNYYGCLRLVNHNLDRIDSQELEDGLEVDVLQWSLTFEKRLNPLARWLLWLLMFVLMCVLVWFCLLRPIYYPHFGKIKKTIIVKQNGKTVYHTAVSFKGARKVVLCDVVCHQSFWNKLFLGQIKPIKSQYFTPMIEITPYKKSAKASGKGYNISPNPMPRNGVATIKRYSSDIIINLK